jgi:hypothetical protein
MKTSKTRRGLVACGLVLFLAASCDRSNEVGGEVSGELVAVDVRITGVKEGSSEEVMRLASVSPLTGLRELVSISHPLGHGLLLDMSLEPDEASGLRAPKPLENGKRFRVVALNHADGKYASHADFIIAAGSSYSDEALYVKAGVSHDFICLSYNSTGTLPAPTASFATGSVPEIAIPSDGTDLLYAKVSDKTINSVAEATLSFTLNHQLSKVTLEIDGSYNGWNITAIVPSRIRLAPFYGGATMNLWSDAITEGAESAGNYFSWTSPITAAQTQTSATQAVFTNSATVSLVIPAATVTINGNTRPSVEQQIAFPTVSTLVPGNSYRLRLRIRTPKFAGSNIYWDGNRLTFDAHYANGGDAPHKEYQGVLFRWGSLVGISPALVGGADRGYTNVAVPVYVPDVKSTLSASTWTPTTSTAKGYVEWKSAPSQLTVGKNEIPYVDSEHYPGGSTTRDDVYLIHADRNTTAMYQGFRGDICQYLSKSKTGVVSSGDYRLPTSFEFGVTENTSWTSHPDGWVKSATFPADNNAYLNVGDPGGVVDFVDAGVGYATNTALGGVVFPASGQRWNGALYYVGEYGQYWTGSAYGAGYGRMIHFTASSVRPHGYLQRGDYAVAVRCVMK